MGEVVNIAPARERAARVRRMLGRSIKSAINGFGEDIAGFALVTWDMRGNARSAILDRSGPIGASLVPTYVHDALNRHVAVEIASESAPVWIEGD